MFTKDEIARREYEKAEKYRRDQASQLRFAEMQGQDKERLSSIRNLTKNLNLTAQQAMDALGIPSNEQGRYVPLL